MEVLVVELLLIVGGTAIYKATGASGIDKSGEALSCRTCGKYGRFWAQGYIYCSVCGYKSDVNRYAYFDTPQCMEGALANHPKTCTVSCPTTQTVSITCGHGYGSAHWYCGHNNNTSANYHA